MFSIWFLVYAAILPIVICRYVSVGKPTVQEIITKPHNGLRNGELLKRELMPNLKIRRSPPKNLEIPSGEGMVLECEAGGNPPATIHWLKDGKRIAQSMYEVIHPVEDDDEYPIPPLGLSFTRSRLFVDCVGPREVGIYTCVAENSFKKTSHSTMVNIPEYFEEDSTATCKEKKSSGLPARIHMWTHTRLELIGSDVQFYCRSTGLPQPTVSWIGPNGLPLPIESDKFEIMENGDLVIHEIKWSDMGEYTCVAENIHGSDPTVTFLYPTQPNKRKPRNL